MYAGTVTSTTASQSGGQIRNNRRTKKTAADRKSLMWRS